MLLTPLGSVFAALIEACATKLPPHATGVGVADCAATIRGVINAMVAMTAQISSAQKAVRRQDASLMRGRASGSRPGLPGLVITISRYHALAWMRLKSNAVSSL